MLLTALTRLKSCRAGFTNELCHFVTGLALSTILLPRKKTSWLVQLATLYKLTTVAPTHHLRRTNYSRFAQLSKDDVTNRLYANFAKLVQPQGPGHIGRTNFHTVRRSYHQVTFCKLSFPHLLPPQSQPPSNLTLCSNEVWCITTRIKSGSDKKEEANA